MDFFIIEWKRSAEKELRKISSTEIPRIIKACEDLSSNAFPSGFKKLEGAEFIYRIRIGDYRVIYEVRLAEKKIVIHYVRHRKDAYKDF